MRLVAKAVIGATLLVALVAGLSPAESAQASSFRHCGSAGVIPSARAELTKVRAKHISCPEARAFARRFTRKAGPETSFACSESLHCAWRGWTCLNDARSGHLYHRCRKPASSRQTMVVKWTPRSPGARAPVLRRCGSVGDPKGPRSKVRASAISCHRARRLARRYVQNDKLTRGWIAVNPGGCDYLMYRRRDRGIYEHDYSPHAGAPIIQFTKFRGCNS